MRKLLLTLTALIAFTGNAYADTIKASVNGLVCAFCATAIEKTFMKQPAVEAVKVDLEHKLVTVTTVAQYVSFLREPDPVKKEAMRQAIMTYNRDDVIATRKLEEWLRDL